MTAMTLPPRARAACGAPAAALVSSLANAALPAEAIYFGEISLSGAIRPVAQGAARLREAGKLGFTSAFIPDAVVAEVRGEAVAATGIVALRDLMDDIVARSPKSPRCDLRRVLHYG